METVALEEEVDEAVSVVEGKAGEEVRLSW